MKMLKVFISSTMTELYNERVALRTALEQRGFEVIWFEGLGARPESPQQAYLSAVGEADLYLGVFWNRYSQATEQEYREATRLGKPCLIYLKEFDAHRDAALTKLLAEISQHVVYQSFTNVVELTALVTHDIQQWIVDRVTHPALASPAPVGASSAPLVPVSRRLPKWLPFVIGAAILAGGLIYATIAIGPSKPADDMVLVPGGKTIIGSTQAEKQKLFDLWRVNLSSLEDLAAMEIDVPAFWIDRFEVSNGEYQKCPATVCKPPLVQDELRDRIRGYHYGNPQYLDYPVVMITWEDAKNYCEKFLGKRLPSEIEWEKAARYPDGRIWTWGNEWQDGQANTGKKTNDTSGRDSFKADTSSLQVRNLAGNAQEWVTSTFETRPGYHVVRGGSWASPPSDTRGATRLATDDERSETIGFRCARNP